MTRSRRRASPRRSFRRRWHVVVVAVVLLGLAAWRWWAAPVQVPPAEFLEEGTYRVERVIDGDTLVLVNHARVRLIGADTPETVHPNHPVEPWGPEATRFTERFVAKGEVQLEFDGPRKDKYKRFLAHVWVDDQMLSEELIRAGLATAETRYRYSSAVKARLLRAEAKARAAGRGIWSD
jgi:micrococcal nuclease